MNIERLTLAVRERGLAECYDLALLWMRTMAGRLALLGIVAWTPWLLLDWWLLGGRRNDDWSTVFWWWVLLNVQAPIATAPISAYLGEALFEPQPSVKRALGTALRRTGALLLVGALRGVMALLVLLVLLWPFHLVEVLALEGQRLGASFSRANTIAGGWRGEGVAHLFLALLVLLIGTVVAVYGVSVLGDLMLHGHMPDEGWLAWLNPGASVLPMLLLAAGSCFLAVVRFIAYIDLRTRREGWEVELDLRRTARRLSPGGEG